MAFQDTPPMGPPDDERARASLLERALDELGEAVPQQEREAVGEIRLLLIQAQALMSVRSDLTRGELLRLKAAAALSILGGHAAEVGNSELAVKLYSAAARENPSDVSFPYNQGNHLHRLGRTEEAIWAYTRALETDPDSTWCLNNRAQRLCDVGRVDDAIEDFIRAARAGCDLDRFHESVARRVIPERGFTYFYAKIATDEELTREQCQAFLQALNQALYDADPWFLSTLVPVSEDLSSERLELHVRVILADIIRESPTEHMVGIWRMHRMRELRTYVWAPQTTSDLTYWYRPAAWGTGGPEPDRVSHLEDLKYAIELAEEVGAPEASWMAHYMSGAIVTSALYGGRMDWPHPVLRLSVPLDERGEPHSTAIRDVASWVAAQRNEHYSREKAPDLLGAFAAGHFRAAAQILLFLRDKGREESLAERRVLQWTHVPKNGGQRGRQTSILTSEEIANLAVVSRSEGAELGARMWEYAEPVFREWVIAAMLSHDGAEHLAATSRARQFNALLATELWKLPTERWLDCRSRIMDAFGEEPAVDHLRDSIGEHGLLVDYFLHEIVEDTIGRLSLTCGSMDAVEIYVDSRAGDLRLLLSAQDADSIPVSGLKGRISELLIGGLERNITDADCIVLVPFGYLRNIPFHALSQVQHAIHRRALKKISYMPSLALAARFKTPSKASRARCLFVGFDSSDEIDIDGEFAVVDNAFDSVTVLTGEDATLDRVADALGEHDTAHFACHGDLDESTRAGYLQLYDSRLYSWDVLTLPKVPDTVILNACLTSVADRFEPTSDTAFGLQHGFLTAGSSHVIGGLWEINEWTARYFADKFYKCWGGGESPAASVLQAQQSLRSQTADPFLWAPHCFFGDWR